MKILLAIDASTAMKKSSRSRSEASLTAGLTVEVLTVVNALEPWALAVIADQMKARAKQIVDGATAHLRSHGLSAEAAVGEGDPKQVILDHAAAIPADLIVVGAHGTSSLEQFLLGSVSKTVLRFAPCSVAIVRDTPTSTALKVLLAVDGSAAAPIRRRIRSRRVPLAPRHRNPRPQRRRTRHVRPARRFRNPVSRLEAPRSPTRRRHEAYRGSHRRRPQSSRSRRPHHLRVDFRSGPSPQRDQI